MGARNDTRAQMVTSAALVLREKGVGGTTVAAVLERSGGPRGSVGFHFPGGRTQLLSEAVREAGVAVTTHLTAQAKGGASPGEVFTGLCEHYARQLEATDYAAGCPVWAVVQEAATDPDLGPLAGSVIDDWTAALATPLAPFAIASLEGAITLARLRRSITPIDEVREHVAPLLDSTTS